MSAFSRGKWSEEHGVNGSPFIDIQMLHIKFHKDSNFLTL